MAGRAGVSRWMIGRIERGDLQSVPVAVVEDVCRALGADLDGFIRWRGVEVDRLLGAGHSAMHEAVIGLLEAHGWEVVPELSFSVWGERGIIDIVAWHAPSLTLLVVELKTEIADVQRLIGVVDRYRRLAPSLVADRGWMAAHVATWVVVADSRTNRRRLAAHAALLRAAFPDDGRTVRGWLTRPIIPLRALSFLSDEHVAARTASRGSRRRVRRRPGSGIDAA